MNISGGKKPARGPIKIKIFRPPPFGLPLSLSLSLTFPFDATASTRLTSATAFSNGFLSSSSAGTITPVPTSIILRSAALASTSSTAGSVLMKTESLVAMSLKGIPTAVLKPSSLYRYGALSFASMKGLIVLIMEPFGLRNRDASTFSPSFLVGSSPTRRAYAVMSRVSTYVRTAACLDLASGFSDASRDSAISERRLHGSYSNSGSSVRDTRTVSPSPSARMVPIPTALFIRPSSPSPASVTPRWRG